MNMQMLSLTSLTSLTKDKLKDGVFSNYWMRLSRIWRILQISEGVIHLGRRPRLITPSSTCRILPSRNELTNHSSGMNFDTMIFPSVKPRCQWKTLVSAKDRGWKSASGTARWKTRGRGPGVQGPGVPGYGVPGCGKGGVGWKTRGLVESAGSNVENTGNHYFSPKYALSSLKWEGKILLAKLRWISIQHLALKRVSPSKK